MDKNGVTRTVWRAIRGANPPWTSELREAAWKALGRADGTAPRRMVRIRNKHGIEDIIEETKQLHHDIPRRHGGTHSPSNLVPVWPEEHSWIDPNSFPGYEVIEILSGEY